MEIPEQRENFRKFGSVHQKTGKSGDRCASGKLKVNSARYEQLHHRICAAAIRRS
jgi:hypothetical protein